VHDTRCRSTRARRLDAALIPRVLARGMPLFAICRGFQETNVALGGTLHQAVQESPAAPITARAKDGRPSSSMARARRSSSSPAACWLR
jgi:gamma-glutamyl-gamma-aminobutyrate hydrolase PuuD